jgi:serine/threonine protein kinase
MEQFMNEVQILSRLRHPNLVALYGCTSRHSRELLLVYEFIPNGTVADHLHGSHAHEKALTWHRRLTIAIEAADALAYLHAVDPPIVHRDVKTSNMLVDAGFHVKVMHFFLSSLVLKGTFFEKG